MQTAVVLGLVFGLDNGLGRTPPLNWSPWNHFTIHADESVIMDNARALVSTGLAKLGYRLVQLDAGSLVARNQTGYLIPNATLFPSGLRHLSERLHGACARFAPSQAQECRCLIYQRT